jgi:transcriptional regulator
VAVYNAAAPAGSASGAAALLTGYTISETANYTGAAPATSVVYYAEGYQSQAQSIASKLDISQVRQATASVEMGNHEVIVVLASDYTG